MNTTLIVLGAGCSVKSGYPAAADMSDQLRAFGDSLGSPASRLQALVSQTVGLFQKLRDQGDNPKTLDDLALLVHNGKLHNRSSPQELLESYRLVEEAKLAVAALFLSKEPQALSRGLSGYASLIRRVFARSYGPDCRAILRNTPYRVLTFNYDRLFEMAFRQCFPYDGTESFYGPTILNSGLFQVDPDKIKIEPDRFTFLKLHGSVGLYGYEYYGNCRHIYKVPNPAKAVSITDNEFFTPDSPDFRNQRNLPKPALIVFPHEKDLLQQYPHNSFAYRLYIPEIWKAARQCASQAEEIWIIGYSCPEPDFPALQSLLDAATNCRQIVIQNPAAKEICERLKLRLAKQAHLFKPYEERF